MRNITNKSLSDISNIRDLRTIPRTRRSAKPQLSTTAILELGMARNERERLVKERMRLAKRQVQIVRRLQEIDREMDELFRLAQKKASDIRGKHSENLKEIQLEKEGGPRKGSQKLVIEY